jgi:hypothetical protein
MIPRKFSHPALFLVLFPPAPALSTTSLYMATDSITPAGIPLSKLSFWNEVCTDVEVVSCLSFHASLQYNRIFLILIIFN